MVRERPWLSASDLAEYAYCPRALYYRRRFPEAPVGPGSEAGRDYHHRRLGAERRRSSHAGAYWAALLVGVGLLVLGTLGGHLG